MIKYLKLFTLTLLILIMGKLKIANAQEYTYGIVFSSENDIQDAKYEIEQLSERLPQYSSLAGLFRQAQQYHSVILFRSETEAQENLNSVSQVYQFIEPSNDIWDLQEECPNWLQNARTAQKIRYYNCP